MKSYCLLKPTWEELQAAHGPWYELGITENTYKAAFMRWRVLERAGVIKFRGGLVKLTRRGWRLYTEMLYARNGWQS